MTTDDLIEKLKEMRAAARWGDNMTAMTQLFGIIFDKGIENSGSNTVAIGRRAGVGGEVTPIRPTSRGSVRCDAVGEGLFSAVALEMDPGNRIFATLPVVPVPEDAVSGIDAGSVPVLSGEHGRIKHAASTRRVGSHR